LGVGPGFGGWIADAAAAEVGGEDVFEVLCGVQEFRTGLTGKLFGGAEKVANRGGDGLEELVLLQMGGDWVVLRVTVADLADAAGDT
jgi:hypothetical protein